MKKIVSVLMLTLAVIVCVSLIDESFDKMREQAYVDSLSACRDSLANEKLRFARGLFDWREERFTKEGGGMTESDKIEYLGAFILAVTMLTMFWGGYYYEKYKAKKKNIAAALNEAEK